MFSFPFLGFLFLSILLIFLTNQILHLFVHFRIHLLPILSIIIFFTVQWWVGGSHIPVCLGHFGICLLSQYNNQQHPLSFQIYVIWIKWYGHSSDECIVQLPLNTTLTAASNYNACIQKNVAFTGGENWFWGGLGGARVILYYNGFWSSKAPQYIGNI